MQLTAVSTIAFADVPPERMSGANTLFNMLQQISLGMGIAIGVAALRIARFLQGGAGPTTVAEFHAAFMVAALVTAASVIDAIALTPNAADHVSRA